MVLMLMRVQMNNGTGLRKFAQLSEDLFPQGHQLGESRRTYSMVQ